MPARAAFRDGVRRVNGAPMVLAGMFAVTLLVALPLSFVLRGDDRGAPRGEPGGGRRRRPGTNYDWWQEFPSQASGLGTTFVPSIIGFGAVLDNLSGLLDNLPLASTIAGVTGAWLVVWSFLSGGVVDRLARGAPHAIAWLFCRVRDALLAVAAARGARVARVRAFSSATCTAGSSPVIRPG